MLGQVVLAANVVVLLFRGVAALDAARCARRSSGHRTGPAARAGGLPGLPGPLSLALGALAAFLVLAPHALFTGAALAAQPVLTQVLQPPPPAPVPAPGGPAPEPTPSDPFAAVLPQLPPPDAARPVWDGKSALNVLLLGTDRRPRDVSMGQWGNSDTILLVSLDPTRQQAAMVSVPRDLLIENIPGVGQEKVNAAYRRGGPDLAMRVVGDLLGVPIHRWASIDTSAFATMIDALGGVVVDVERPIRDDEFPNEDYSVRRILIPSGLQWLDGERALWYARSRHGSNDFDRSERQQRLLLSLKGRARDPTVVPRLPGMVALPGRRRLHGRLPREALTLASLGVKTDFKTVRGLVLTPPEYGAILNRPDLFAVVPNRQRIRRDVAALLSAEASPSSPSPSPIAGRPLTPLPVEPDPEASAPGGAPGAVIPPRTRNKRSGRAVPMAAMPDLSPSLFASRFLLVAYATVATILATACLALHLLTRYDRRPGPPGALARPGRPLFVPLHPERDSPPA